MPGITQFLSIIFQSMTEIVESSPKLLKLLEGEFPRANALFQRDMHIQTTTGGIGDPEHQGVFASLAMPAFDSPIWDHGVWQMFCELQSLCRDWKEDCGRRECPNRGKAVIKSRAKLVSKWYSVRACVGIGKRNMTKDVEKIGLAFFAANDGGRSYMAQALRQCNRFRLLCNPLACTRRL